MTPVEAAAGKLAAWLEAYRLLLTAEPLIGGLYLAAMATLLGAAFLCVALGRPAPAYWCVVGALVVQSALSFGEDIEHHVFRIVAVAEQLRHGGLDLLVTSPATGEALPIFVYYSLLPYLPPALLNLAGVPAHASFRIAMAGLLLVMALGLRALAAEAGAGEPLRRKSAWLAVLLFVSANYVYALWLVRAAFAEIAVYCLVPWITLALLRGRSIATLATLMLLQAAAHPLMFGYALAAELVVAWGLSRETPVVILRRCLLPAVAAVIVGAPFWLPAVMWKDFIRGTVGLPWPFEETFLSLGQLLDRRYERNIGLALPLAVLALVAGARLGLPGRAWALVAAFAAFLAMQTHYLRPLLAQMPLLPHSQFIWRLMLPTAFIGAGALIAGWPAIGQRWRWPLTALAMLSIVNLATVLIGSAPSAIALHGAPTDDRTWFRRYDKGERGFGKIEFAPNYTTLPARPAPPDGEVRTVTFGALRPGVAAPTPYLLVPHGPVGLVEYTMDGAPLSPLAANGGLLLGPLRIGSTVGVSDTRLTVLLWLRLVAILIAATGLAVIALSPRASRARSR